MSGLSDARRRMSRWLAVAVLAVVVAPCTASADPKIDVVQLRNGDRITCEIKQLEQASLTVSTDPLGTVSVHWAEVATLTSPRFFEVTVESGAKYYGALAAPLDPGVLLVDDASGSAPVSVPLVEVIGIVPIGRSIWARMDGAVDVGLTVAQANAETHYTVNASDTYRSPTFRIGAALSSQLTARADTPRQLRTTLTLNGSRLYDNQWFATVLGQIQQNDELQLDLRTVGGGGLGKGLSQTNHHSIALYSGLVYTREQFVDQPVNNSAEVAVGGELDFFTPTKEDFSLTNSVVSYFSLSDPGRVRLELQSAWRHEFLSDFYWAVNGVESFDSRPPDAEKKNDFSLSLSIGWKF